MDENDVRLQKFASIRASQRLMVASIAKIERDLDDLNRRLDVLGEGITSRFFAKASSGPASSRP